MWSLNVPGSASSQLHTRYRGRPLFGKNDHLRPVGNPAPPRPRSPLLLVISATSAGFISVTARFHCSYPPRFWYTAISRRSTSPMPSVNTFTTGTSAIPRCHYYSPHTKQPPHHPQPIARASAALQSASDP